MKKKLNLTLIALLALITSSLIIGFLIGICLIFTNNLRRINLDYFGPLIGGIGNFSGGLIGGIVAYIVAAYQIQKNREHDKEKGVSGDVALIRLVKIELEANKRLISSNKEDYYSGKQEFLKYLSDSNWVQSSTLLGPDVSDEVISTIHSTYNKIRLIKSDRLLPVDVYDNLMSDISDCISKLNKEMESMNSK